MYLSDDGNPSAKGNTKTSNTTDNTGGTKNTTGNKMNSKPLTLAQKDMYADLRATMPNVKYDTNTAKDMLENYKEKATGIVTTTETGYTGEEGAETKDIGTDTIYGLPKMVVYGGGAVLTLALLYFILKD